MIRRRVTVLGSTGSVGASTLDLMDQAEAAGTGAFEVVALTGGNNIERLAEQARRWRPAVAVTADPDRLEALRAALTGTGIAVAAGEAAVVEAATRPADLVMAAIVVTPHAIIARIRSTGLLVRGRPGLWVAEIGSGLTRRQGGPCTEGQYCRRQSDCNLTHVTLL